MSRTPRGIHDETASTLRRCNAALERYLQLLDASRAAAERGDAALLDSLLDAGDEAAADARRCDRAVRPALALLLERDDAGQETKAIRTLYGATRSALARVRRASEQASDAGRGRLDAMARELLADAAPGEPARSQIYPHRMGPAAPVILDATG